MLQHYRTYQHHREVGHESRARVHKHTDEDGHHRIGQDIDMDKRVTHKECRCHSKHDDKRIEHHDAARLVEIVDTVKAQIYRKAYHDDGHIQYLACE